MASGIFAILDDIAALMDDVSVSVKIATQKTAGILGDDLAVNAEKATGFLSSRELPVLWSITKGSFLNKLIIVPLVLILNSYLPDAIHYILILGGLYLAYEGVEKIIEYLFHRKKTGAEIIKEATQNDALAEKTKIKSAITTDFILSVEIVILALNAVIDRPLTEQIITVSIVSIIATVGVYGIVAMIVRLDDVGYSLMRRAENKGIMNKLGGLLVKSLPIIIKALSVIGTIALIFVAGGIFSHHITVFKNWMTTWPAMLKEPLLGLIMGCLVVLVLLPFKKLFAKRSKPNAH